MRSILLAIVALLGSASSAGAQTGNPDELVVRGRRAKELAELIDAMAPSRSGRQIARWEQRVCTQVFGLEAQHAAFIKERIDSMASELKLGAAKSPKCRPDVSVVFTLDADDVAAQIVRRYPELVGEIGRGAVNKRSKAAYLLPRAVRWFGQDWTKGEELPISTRLRTGSRQTIDGILVLVDLTKLGGISWGQLADFLAFVSMSRPQLDHVYTDGGTILSLFTARDQGMPLPPGITPLDRSFLVNLYSTEASRTPEQQQQDIRRHVKADLAKQRAQADEGPPDQ